MVQSTLEMACWIVIVEVRPAIILVREPERYMRLDVISCAISRQENELEDRVAVKEGAECWRMS